MVGATGIEPVAPAMSRQCSPAELRAHPSAKNTRLAGLAASLGRDSARRGGFNMAMDVPVAASIAPPVPIVVLRPARQTIPVVFASPHSGRCYPDELLAASRLDGAEPAPQRGQLRRRTVRRGAGAWRPAARGHLPARLVRRQPRAVGARSGDVRRPAAVLGEHHQRPGRRRARHDRAGRGVRRGDLSRQAVVRRRGAADPHLLAAVPRRAWRR